MVLKAKVVYDFQSIEFEDTVTNNEEVRKFFERFESILKDLSEVASKYPQPSKTPQKSEKKAVKKEPMASPNQIRFLIGLGVDKEEAQELTSAEASDLIKELKELGNNG